MKQFSFQFLLVVSLIFVAPLIINAQTFQNLGGQTSNTIVQINPPQPQPNQFVTIDIENYGTDLDRSDISWFLNGKLEKQATGAKSFLLKTGAPGSISNVLILIKTPEGATLQQVVNIRPAGLDLVWEAQSYSPPFYRGKALYPYQGTVKLVALPSILDENGEILNPKNLIYIWSVDGDSVANISGYGKNFMFFNGSVPLNPATIGVVASSLDKKYSASGEVTLTPQSPLTLFYEENPLYGVLYNKTLTGNLALQNEEIKIIGIPYFIGVREREGAGLIYEWQLNNQNASGDKAISSLSFKRENDAEGSALIGLQISNPSKMFQFASNLLSLSFGRETSLNLFGAQ